MVVCKSDDHDGADDDLAVLDDGFLFDGVHAEDGGLREVDDWSSVEGAEDAAVRAADHMRSVTVR